MCVCDGVEASLNGIECGPWSIVSLLIVWSTMVWVLTKRFESFVAAVARYGPLELDSQFAEVPRDSRSAAFAGETWSLCAFAKKAGIIM